VDNTTPQFLVIGAGIGGICGAIDLAEAGYGVTLVEKEPRTGGILPQLDHQFADNHCGMCRLLPMLDRDDGGQTCLKRGLTHDNIRILTRTTLTDLSGQPGNYSATLTSVSRGVDETRCTACLACIDACPVSVPDEFNAGVEDRKAVFRPFFGNPTALPTIDWDDCTRCAECVRACPNAAIDLERSEHTHVLPSVAGVIVAGGNRLYDPADTDLYGHGVLPNVVTATAFERILSGSGPSGGQARRPADGKPIRKIAWIQCVGSRNVMIGAPHCSSSCCMFALKEALLAKEKLGPSTETTIFYMDLRTDGRDWQRYRDRAEEEAGVRFIRCRIHSVEPADAPGDLKLAYVDEASRPAEAVFDMVVLSTGAGVQPAFPSFLANRTAQDGVVSVGPAAGFQDIRETVLRAHGAAAALLRFLPQAHRQTIIPSADKAGDTQVNRFSRQPSIQILLLDNGAVHTPRVDWPAIEACLDPVVDKTIVERLSLNDTDAAMATLDEVLKNTRGNRLLAVGNHFGAYRARLAGCFDKAGFSAALVEWLELDHSGACLGSEDIDPMAAVKAIDAARQRLLHRRSARGAGREVDRRALVIGAGPAGLSAAVYLAEQGIAVDLVEKASAIGGNGPRIREEHQRQAIAELMNRASGHGLISVHTSTTLTGVTGRAGRFDGWIVQGNQEAPIAFGAAIVATGGAPVVTDHYGLGRHPRVVSHYDFEAKINEPQFAHESLNAVVMIQCAGSREEPRNYCSRTCCLKSLNNALTVRRLFPDTRIVVFYRDIMTTGTHESLYAEARTRNIEFIPFDKSKPPRVQADGERIIVEAFDPLMGEACHLTADWVSLALGMAPNPVYDLCRMFAIPVTADGFVQEADAKWRPVDTIHPGVFVCGLARGPLRVDEAVAEGEAAALRALRLLNRHRLVAPRRSAVVRHAICSRCYLCVDACPYGARFVEPAQGRVEVDPAGCQGCGACASVCPNSATILGDDEDFSVMNVIEAML
jgi:heterodisulfide reductase subunit A2